jgi:hypothetical protein
MSCEEASKRLIKAHNAKTRVDQELTQLLLSFISTPGHPGEPIMEGSEKVQRVDRLTREQELASQRLRAAWVAFREARKRHRD